MIGVGGIRGLPLIRIGNQSVIRERPDGERMRCVKTHLLLKPVGEKEIVPAPAVCEPRQLSRIEFETDSLTRSKHGKPIVRNPQQLQHVAVPGVVSSGSRIRTCLPSACVGIRGIAPPAAAGLTWITPKINSCPRQRHSTAVLFACVWRSRA